MTLFSGNKIQPLDNQVSKEPSLIFKPSFFSYIVASKGSGKSVLLLNMLLNKDMLANKFNQIYFISPTASLDQKTQILKTTKDICVINKPLLNLLKKEKKNHRIFDELVPDHQYFTSVPESNFIDECDLKLLQDLIEQQKAVINRYTKEVADTILLVYDDCIANTKFFSSSSFKKMVFLSRHYKISIIITSQSYRALNKSLRLNISNLILFNTSNEDEIKVIYSENASSLGFKQFLKMYNEVTEVPYGFLVVSYQNPIKYRYQNQFLNFILPTNTKNKND